MINDFDRWVATASPEELRQEIDKLEGEINAVWTPGSMTSMARNRYDIHDSLVMRIRQIVGRLDETL